MSGDYSEVGVAASQRTGRSATVPILDRTIGAARRYLPQGGTLSEERWWKRHRGVLGLLWLHALAVPIYAVIRDLPVLHVLGESLVVPVSAVVASMTRLPRRARTFAAAIGLLTSSGILVHLSGGLIELHFHFFVMVVVISLYQDWVPFLAAIGYVLVHHGLVGALDPGSVYNHAAAINNPWKWAAIHAFFIAGISAASLVSWRLNETIFRYQLDAEERLREEARIVETLNEVGKTLAENLELGEVVQRVIDAGTQRTSAEFGAFFYNVVDDNGESYLLNAISGAPLEAFSKFPSPRNTAIFAPTFAGEGVVRLDDVTADPRYGKNPPYQGMPEGHLPVRSYLAVPVRSREGVIGGLFFGHTEVGRFTDIDERIAVGVAAHAAIAVENAKLFQAERKARAHEEQARKRLAVISDASRTLAASLDLDAILRRLADLLVPSIADNCVIDFLEDDDALRRMHLAIEPRAQEAYSKLLQGSPSPRTKDHPAIGAIKTGKSILVEDVSTETIAQVVKQPDYRSIVDDVGPLSAAIVPIICRDGVFGALTLATTASSGRRLDAEDLALVEELARRAANAIENARRYESQRDAALTLQHSLLPARLPGIDGVALAAQYRAGAAGLEVGGDWYDAIALPDGRLLCCVGDVVGRGLIAATRMGQIRAGLRAYALSESSPAALVVQLDKLVESFDDDTMATVVCAVVDLADQTVTIARAGHPPALLVDADGSAKYLEGGGTSPLGYGFSRSATEETVAFLPGSMLVLYTDGLVERREGSIDRQLDRLLHIGAAHNNDPEALCQSAVSQLHCDDHVDDIAILAVRTQPVDELVQRFPADPGSLARVRRELQHWLLDNGVRAAEISDVVLAVNEAVSNVVEHAYPEAEGAVTVRATFDDESLCVRVRDVGTWRETPGEKGRGIGIMRAVMDSVIVRPRDAGTEVELRRKVTANGKRAKTAVAVPDGEGTR